MQALGVLLLLSVLAGAVHGITWDFGGGWDTQGWSARQADGRSLVGEMTEEAWRVRVPSYAADELLDAWANSVALVSPRLGHDSALFDELRLRFRVVTATPYRGSAILRWRNPHNRAQPGQPQYWVSAAGLSLITGEWQEVAFTGLRDGADCGYPLYTSDGVPLPCSLVWEGELLDLRIELPTWDAGTGSRLGGEGVAEGVEVDWIRLTGFGEQIEGELPSPAVTSAGPAGTLFEAPRFSLLPVSNPGMFGYGDPGESGEALGDVDRDGRADVLAVWEKDLVGEQSSRSGWFVALGDGLGGFPRLVDEGDLARGRMCRLAGGDLDNDGDLDAVVMVGMDTPEMLMNDEREGWVRMALPGAGERGLVLLGVGDADADGDADVWFDGGEGDVGVLVNQGTSPGELRYWRPSGAPAEAFPWRLVPGLGPLGVTGALWGGPVETQGLGGYTVGYLAADGEVVEAHLGPASIRQLQGAADLDGDGDVDLLLYRETEVDPRLAYRGLQVLQNQGDGTWVETDWQPEARLLCPPTLSDVNGDGLIDVVWADATFYDPGVVVALGRAGDVPQVEGRYPLSGGTGGPILAGDVNGDGRTDLVVLEKNGYAGDGVHVLLNTGQATAVAAVDGRPTPAGFQLGAAYPNPFNPQTWIPVTVPPGAEPVRLQVYDVLGRPIRSLMSGGLRPGYQVVLWDGRDETGQTVAAGVYLYRLEGRRWAQSRKMLKVD